MPRAKTAKIRSMRIEPHLQVTPSERYSRLNQLMMRSGNLGKSQTHAKQFSNQVNSKSSQKNRVRSAFRNYQPQSTHMYDVHKRNNMLSNKRTEESMFNRRGAQVDAKSPTQASEFG